MNELVLLISLMVAYFIQNLAVFDSLATYMPLMMMLGFIYWLSTQETEFPAGNSVSKEFINKEIYDNLRKELVEISKMIAGLRKYLNREDPEH